MSHLGGVSFRKGHGMNSLPTILQIDTCSIFVPNNNCEHRGKIHGGTTKQINLPPHTQQSKPSVRSSGNMTGWGLACQRGPGHLRPVRIERSRSTTFSTSRTVRPELGGEHPQNHNISHPFCSPRGPLDYSQRNPNEPPGVETVFREKKLGDNQTNCFFWAKKIDIFASKRKWSVYVFYLQHIVTLRDLFRNVAVLGMKKTQTNPKIKITHQNFCLGWEEKNIKKSFSPSSSKSPFGKKSEKQ